MPPSGSLLPPGCQGALTYPSGKVGLKLALQSMLEQGALKL